MRFPRSSGVLLHPTSLPGRFGVGDFGPHAYAFVDFLERSRQSLWQLLPLGPTGYGDSPYQSFSAFAGNPMLISPQLLVEDGYLPPEAIEDVPQFPRHRVDYGWVIDYKGRLLQEAHRTFRQQASAEHRAAYEQFCSDNEAWLDDYALFMAVKHQHVEQHGGVWNTWPRDIAQREPEAMERWASKLEEEVARHKFQQFIFFEQWLALKQYANERGIQIVGDVPIFVA